MPPYQPKLLPLAQGRLTGHVICNDTHLPARGAVLTLMQTSEQDNSEAGQVQQGLLMTRSGIDGGFLIEHVPAGDYAVVTCFPGYLNLLDSPDLVLGQTGADAQSFLDAQKKMRAQLAAHGTVHVGGHGTQTSEVTIERGAAVTGRVLYADGSPATQVDIVVEAVNEKRGPGMEESATRSAVLRTMFTHQSSATDDQGHFRISGIQPGTYRIAAVPPPSMEGASSEAQGIGMAGAADPAAIRFYSGDTIHRKSAKMYDLRAGDTVADLDIRLPIDGLRTVRLKLTATDGRAINHADATLTDNADNAVIFHGSSDQEGNYRFSGVPPGTYTLAVKSATIDPTLYGLATAAFADVTSAVIVKDGEVPEIALSPAEVPLPKQTGPGPDAGTPGNSSKP